MTGDKDFGELVYRLNKVHSGVILMRLDGLKPKTKGEIIESVLKSYAEELSNSFVVIQPGAIRIRKFMK